jgi:hypothetical protein
MSMGIGVDAGSMLVPEVAWLSWASMRLLADIDMDMGMSIFIVFDAGMSSCCACTMVEIDASASASMDARSCMSDPLLQKAIGAQLL